MVAAMALTLLVAGLPRLLSSRAERQGALAGRSAQLFLLAQRRIHSVHGVHAWPAELLGRTDFRGTGVTMAPVLPEVWSGLAEAEGVAGPCPGWRAAFAMADDRQRWALVLWPATWGSEGQTALAVTESGQRWRLERRRAPERGTTWSASAAWASAFPAGPLTARTRAPAADWELDR
jgi:hypothetical protein